MVYRDFCYRLKGLFFLHVYRVSNPTVFLYCIISGSHQQFIGFLTTNIKALFLPRVLNPPHVYNLIEFPFFSRTISGEIQCSSQEREAPGLQTHSQGNPGVAAPVEKEGCDLCEAISALGAQIGLFFQESFGGFPFLMATAPCGCGGLAFTFLTWGRGDWLWKGVFGSGGLFLGVCLLVPEEGQAILEGGPTI